MCTRHRVRPFTYIIANSARREYSHYTVADTEVEIIDLRQDPAWTTSGDFLAARPSKTVSGRSALSLLFAENLISGDVMMEII